MPMIEKPSAGQLSEIHWKSLRYFNFYRFCIAGLLFFSSFFQPTFFSILTPDRGLFHLGVTSLYLLATTFSLVGLHYYHRRFNLQLSVHVLVDILVLILLIHAAGGLRSGLGTMLLVTLAGAGLVGQGRLVLFYAAVTALAVLLEQSYRALMFEVEVIDFFQAGLFSAGFFGVAISARLLARRVIANEELARRRGVALKNQTLVSQRAMEEMQEGVLVLDRQGWVKQHNPRAEQLLGLEGDSFGRNLADYSPELAHGFLDWCEHSVDESVVARIPASGLQLRARFVSTDSSEQDVLVFLEDMGRLQEQARQLKLAALGRLTANIAHEIRNPLSAINHAGELMREEENNKTGERLLSIILDNAQRVERIVSDVLELGRRDRAHREIIDLRQVLPNFLEEFTVKERVEADLVRLELQGAAKLCFDRSHFHQVLWNLLGNAFRHSRRQSGSIRLRAKDGATGWVELHIIDDGEGVDEVRREQVFEPFFTTHNRGTGLGLYIARELCEVNGARLELLDSQSGADFCIYGRSIACQ